jgi:hypothetical protein
MVDTTLYDATVPTQGTLANAHELILRMKRGGVFENITGDINNFNDVPTAVTQARENYGQKGTPSIEKIGDSWVITFDVELVRNPTTKEVAAAQAWLVELLNIAKSKGSANKAPFQWFDAFSTTLPAYEGNFSVTAVKTSSGYADKRAYTVTLTSDGVVTDITSPIAGTGVPILESALPTAQVASKNIVVKGYNLGNITAATVGGVAVASITNVPNTSNYVVLEMPAGSAGPAAILLTNDKGISTSLPYNRGA